MEKKNSQERSTIGSNADGVSVYETMIRLEGNCHGAKHLIIPDRFGCNKASHRPLFHIKWEEDKGAVLRQKLLPGVIPADRFHEEEKGGGIKVPLLGDIFERKFRECLKKWGEPKFLLCLPSPKEDGYNHYLSTKDLDKPYLLRKISEIIVGFGEIREPYRERENLFISLKEILVIPDKATKWQGNLEVFSCSIIEEKKEEFFEIFDRLETVMHTVLYNHCFTVSRGREEFQMIRLGNEVIVSASYASTIESYDHEILSLNAGVYLLQHELPRDGAD